MVDRFDYVGGSYPMEIKPNGEFVEYDDYAALEARVAELEKDAARYRFLVDCQSDALVHNWMMFGEDELDAAIEKSREA